MEWRDYLLGEMVLEQDCDRKVTMYVFGDEYPLLAILRRNGIGLWADNYKNPETKERRKYRGSGTFEHWRNECVLHISYDVGCWCSHDCCGHMCGMSYVINKLDGVCIVLETLLFNY